MDRLSVGMNIMIKRSDGRTHSAIISKLKDAETVDVEWFEHGETKGKGVDIAHLIRFNPAIFGVDQKEEPKSAKKVAPVAQVHREHREQPAVNMRHSLMPTQNNVAVAPVEKKKVRASAIGVTDVKEHKERAPLKRPTLTARQSLISLNEQTPVEEVKTFANHVNEENIPAAGRKSHVVLQAEEIEKNRQERRQQQDQARRERDNFRAMDPGNPNWEFFKMIRDTRAVIDFKPLKMTDPVVDNRICVCVRKRPLSKKELTQKEIEVITIPTKDQIIVHQPQTKVDLTKYLENQKFRFDYAFDDTSSNEMVYRFTAQPLVKTIFQGGFATCFAYGQTGSGKTHTMGGDFEGKTQDCSKGIYALAAADVFNYLNRAEYRDMNLRVDCSFFELYGSKAFDLLNKKKLLRILEDNKKAVQIVGLKEQTVKCSEDVLKLIREGSSQRTAGQTSANSNSSRSHAVFQIVLKTKDDNLYGKFSLIDLAGNERGADTKSSNNQTRLEGAEINKSLLSLKECIRAMGMMKDYIPFRGSKLTLVLRDSFTGKNAKTCMIATISPSLLSAENTLNTLRYANRAKELASDGGDREVEYLSEDESPVEEEPVFAQPQKPASVKKDKSISRTVKKEYAAALEALEQAESDSINAFDLHMDAVHAWYTKALEVPEFIRSDQYDIQTYHDKCLQLSADWEKMQTHMKQMNKCLGGLQKRIQAEQDISKRL